MSGIGDGGHPGYRAVCGVGVGITVNGHAYTGTFGHSLTLTISGFQIKPGDRVALWNGKTFVFTGAPRGSLLGGDQLQGIRRGLRRAGAGGWRWPASRRGAGHLGHAVATEPGSVLTSLFLAPVGQSPAGIGVLAPRWLTFISR